jgi:predicted GH43/DUF377 family glycosyl hydrolase
LSAQQCDLIGAYCTQEYSVEAAALFNPSIVSHPDQTDLQSDEVRFVMSVRAVGEGHISSIEFRTGVLGAGEQVRVDDPGRHLSSGRPSPAPMSRDVLGQALAESGGSTVPSHLFELLPAEITSADLDIALVRAERERLTRGSPTESIRRMRLIASSHYRLDFAPERPLSERVLQPHSPDEARGMEDARFTRFIDDSGALTYYATYTAYDGSHQLRKLPTSRGRREEQGHGPLSPPSRWPVSGTLTMGSREHRHRRIIRHHKVERYRHGAGTRTTLGAHSTRQLRPTAGNT